MLYRILETLKYLDTGRRLEAGTINDLKRVSPESIAMLIAKGRIAEVHPPPLAALPGWKERAAEYAGEGIQDVNDMASLLQSEGGVVDRDDFEEALKWSTAEYDGPGATPIGKAVYELSEDAYELKDVDDELDNEV